MKFPILCLFLSTLIVPLHADLVAYWSFPDTANLGNDSIGGAVLTPNGGAAHTPTGKFGGGLALSSASSQFLSGTVDALPVGDSPYTISVWINTPSAGSQGIVGWGSYGNFREVNAFRTNGTGLTNYWWSADLATPALSLNDSTWHHVAATYDGTTRRIYFDGNEEAMDISGTHNATNVNFRIGSTNFAEYFNGTLDEVAIFDHALTATEISGLASATGPLVSTVNNAGDSSPGSLRDAVTIAGANPGPNIIIFSDSFSFQTDSIKLDTEIAVTDPAGLTIIGSHPIRDVTLDGQNSTRLFNVNSGGNLTLKRLHLIRGKPLGFENGGAILHGGSGALSLDSCTLSQCAADNGGAISTSIGTLSINNCTLFENTASVRGGAIHSETTSIGFSLVTTTTLSQCSLIGNSAGSTGGAIYNLNGLTTIISCTLTGNHTLPGNSGGIASYGDIYTRTDVENSIVSGNTNSDVDYVSGVTNSFNSLGHNLIGSGNATGNFTATGDIPNISDPALSSLGWFGGPTMTCHPLAGSPATDAAASSVSTTDQRGFPRAVDSDGNTTILPDIGAVEGGPLALIVDTATDTELRNAIAAASSADATVIRFTSPPAGPTPVTATFPLVNKTIFIDASELPADTLILDRGNGSSSVFTVDPDSTLAIHNLTVAGGEAIEGGGIRSEGNITILDSSIILNTAERGAGVWLGTPGRLLIDGSAVDDNTSSLSGGGIYSIQGRVIIRDSSVSQNTSAGFGGGIYDSPYPIAGDSLTISNSTINQNAAAGIGGGIFTAYGTVTVVGGTISSNQASSGGGVGSNDGCFFFTDVTIGGPTPADGNTATNDGGGLFVPGTSFFAGMDIIRGSISHNTAGVNGGGCWNASAGPPLIDGTLISNNTAGEEGGGVWTCCNTLNIANATISGNTANSGDNGNEDQGGGGVFHSSGTLTISNSTISGNNAALNDGNGGGIYNAANGDLTVNSTTIDGNQAYYGGGIQSQDAIAVVNSSTLSGNSASIGGGVFPFSTSGMSSSMTLNHSTLSGNFSTSSGGGAFVSAAGTSSLTLNHTTVAGNTAISDGGGISRNSGSLTLDSSIIANNQSGTQGDSDISGDYVAATGRTSIVKAHPLGTQSGSGTISTADPLLAPLGDYGGPTQTMLLLYGSPAIDAASGSTATTDQRMFGIVGINDLGATEFQENDDLALLWTLDFDGDGSPYGAELALGTDPLVSDPGNPRNLTAPEFQPNGDANVTFGYNGFAPPGTNWILNRSTTLLPGSFSEFIRIDTINPSIVDYTITDPAPPQPAAFYQFEARFIPPAP